MKKTFIFTLIIALSLMLGTTAYAGTPDTGTAKTILINITSSKDIIYYVTDKIPTGGVVVELIADHSNTIEEIKTIPTTLAKNSEIRYDCKEKKGKDNKIFLLTLRRSTGTKVDTTYIVKYSMGGLDQLHIKYIVKNAAKHTLLMGTDTNNIIMWARNDKDTVPESFVIEAWTDSEACDQTMGNLTVNVAKENGKTVKDESTNLPIRGVPKAGEHLKFNVLLDPPISSESVRTYTITATASDLSVRKLIINLYPYVINKGYGLHYDMPYVNVTAIDLKTNKVVESGTGGWIEMDNGQPSAKGLAKAVALINKYKKKYPSLNSKPSFTLLGAYIIRPYKTSATSDGSQYKQLYNTGIPSELKTLQNKTFGYSSNTKADFARYANTSFIVEMPNMGIIRTNVYLKDTLDADYHLETVISYEKEYGRTAASTIQVDFNDLTETPEFQAIMKSNDLDYSIPGTMMDSKGAHQITNSDKEVNTAYLDNLSNIVEVNRYFTVKPKITDLACTKISCKLLYDDVKSAIGGKKQYEFTINYSNLSASGVGKPYDVDVEYEETPGNWQPLITQTVNEYLAPHVSKTLVVEGSSEYSYTSDVNGVISLNKPSQIKFLGKDLGASAISLGYLNIRGNINTKRTVLESDYSNNPSPPIQVSSVTISNATPLASDYLEINVDSKQDTFYNDVSRWTPKSPLKDKYLNDLTSQIQEYIDDRPDVEQKYESLPSHDENNDSLQKFVFNKKFVKSGYGIWCTMDYKGNLNEQLLSSDNGVDTFYKEEPVPSSLKGQLYSPDFQLTQLDAQDPNGSNKSWVRTVESDDSNISAIIQDANVRIANIHNFNSAISQSYSRLNGTMPTINKLQTSINEHKNKIATCQSQIAALQASIDASQRQIQELCKSPNPFIGIAIGAICQSMSYTYQAMVPIQSQMATLQTEMNKLQAEQDVFCKQEIEFINTCKASKVANGIGYSEGGTQYPSASDELFAIAARLKKLQEGPNLIQYKAAQADISATIATAITKGKAIRTMPLETITNSLNSLISKINARAGNWTTSDTIDPFLAKYDVTAIDNNKLTDGFQKIQANRDNNFVKSGVVTDSAIGLESADPFGLHLALPANPNTIARGTVTHDQPANKIYINMLEKGTLFAPKTYRIQGDGYVEVNCYIITKRGNTVITKSLANKLKKCEIGMTDKLYIYGDMTEDYVVMHVNKN